MKKTLHCVFFLLAITLVPLQSVHALAIIADATGYNVGYVTDFWGVEFISGEGYITSVTFDVTSTGGYFDFDGSDFLDPLIPGVEPIIGATNGLSIGDIDFPRANGGAVGQLPLANLDRPARALNISSKMCQLSPPSAQRPNLGPNPSPQAHP